MKFTISFPKILLFDARAVTLRKNQRIRHARVDNCWCKQGLKRLTCFLWLVGGLFQLCSRIERMSNFLQTRCVIGLTLCKLRRTVLKTVVDTWTPAINKKTGQSTEDLRGLIITPVVIATRLLPHHNNEIWIVSFRLPVTSWTRVMTPASLGSSFYYIYIY